MNKNILIELLKTKEVKKILSEIGIKHIYLVGSYSRGDNTNYSDIDLIYEKSKDSLRVGGLKFIKNKMLLEKILNKRVDLVNIDYIYNDIRNTIDKDKILIY